MLTFVCFFKSAGYPPLVSTQKNTAHQKCNLMFVYYIYFQSFTNCFLGHLGSLGFFGEIGGQHKVQILTKKTNVVEKPAVR